MQHVCYGCKGSFDLLQGVSRVSGVRFFQNPGPEVLLLASSALTGAVCTFATPRHLNDRDRKGRVLHHRFRNTGAYEHTHLQEQNITEAKPTPHVYGDLRYPSDA